MTIVHKGSHKADRTELLKSPPLFSEVIDKIKNLKRITKAERAFFALAIGTGARCTEVCLVRARDITFYDYNGQPIPPKDVMVHNTARITIVMTNLKNKRNKIKTGSIIKNQIFLPIIEWLVDRYREIGDAQDTRMYPKSRASATWLTKELGDNWFPHIFRHYYVSNLARAGVSPQIIKVAVGWSSLENWNTYAHLTVKEITDELKKCYGDSIPVGNGQRPLSLHQAIGAIAAKNEVCEKEIKEFKQGRWPTKVSMLKINNRIVPVKLSSPAKLVRNKLREQPKQQVLENDMIQVV